MTRSTRSRRRAPEPGADTAQAVRDSAQKIWLAGLGAFERARTEGPRMFESLVEQGRNMGSRAVGMADEALKSMRQANFEASGRWDKLEQVFEDRVSKSLSRLGVITAREVEELSRQVQDLNDTVRRMMAEGAGTGRASRSGGARKASAKPAGRKRKAPAGRRKKAA